MSNVMVGAYGPFSTQLSKEAKEAFAEGTERLAGVKYEPLAAASQVVSGTNYAFFCNANIVAPGSASYPAMVSIFKPLQGPAAITHIQKVSI